MNNRTPKEQEAYDEGWERGYDSGKITALDEVRKRVRAISDASAATRERLFEMADELQEWIEKKEARAKKVSLK
jgi:hypothetical protein